MIYLNLIEFIKKITIQILKIIIKGAKKDISDLILYLD